MRRMSALIGAKSAQKIGLQLRQSGAIVKVLLLALLTKRAIAGRQKQTA